MTKIASASGTIIFEDGARLYLAKTPGSWTSTFIFVVGLLSVIMLVNGALQLFVMQSDNGSSTVGLGLLAIGTFLAFSCWRVILYHRRNRLKPIDQLEKVAVIDFHQALLLNAEQQVLAPLQQVRLVRKMQISSSSPELFLTWPQGSLSIAQGNPFSGGVRSIEEVLVARGVERCEK